MYDLQILQALYCLSKIGIYTDRSVSLLINALSNFLQEIICKSDFFNADYKFLVLDYQKSMNV